jgi:hypothetical protein
MKKYKIRFKGVTIGSIGKKRLFVVTVEAENFKEANLKLYDNYEHIFIEKVNGRPYSYINEKENPQ